jgi:hypothetical protein
MLVCDDLLYTITGKLNLIGIYTTDIGIPVEAHVAAQMIFLFNIEGDLSEQPKDGLHFELQMPGEEAKTLTVPVPVLTAPAAPGRTRWFARIPFLVQPVVLRAGQIKATIKHEPGEDIAVAGPWITLMSAPPTSAPSSAS